jgi:hypothetical protein
VAEGKISSSVESRAEGPEGKTEMKLKGYYYLKILGPNKNGGFNIYHPKVGEIRVSSYLYRSKFDEWDIVLWIEDRDQEEKQK